MGRRHSGNGGGGAPRAELIARFVPQRSGWLTTVSRFGLLEPVEFAKTGGNVNLSIDAASGAIDAASALAADETQSLSGTATGADDCIIPFTTNLTGRAGPSDTVGLKMLALPANRIFQRSTTTGSVNGKGEGAISVPITLSAAAALIEYRLRDAATQAIVQDWSTAANNLAASATEAICANVPARLGWYLIDLRANGDDTQVQLGNSPIAMGRLIAASGQSLAVRMFARMDGQTATNASLSVLPSADTAVYATYNDSQRTLGTPAWTRPADGSTYDSTFAAEFLRLEALASGVSCGLVGHARGSQAIAAFLPGGSENAALCNVLDAAGGFETFIWLQGHSDAKIGLSATAYRAALGTLFADLTAHNAVRGAGYDTLMTTIPNITSTQWGTPDQQQAIRSAAAAWCAANDGIDLEPRDLELVDGVHPSQAGAIRLAGHFYRGTRIGLGLGDGDDGPVITGASRAAGSADVVLAITHTDRASMLVAVGNPATRFNVCNAGSTSALPLDAAAPILLGGATITLRLGAAPADDQALDVYFTYPPDPSDTGQTDMIHDDNLADSDALVFGRQLTPTLAPVRVAATTVVPSAPVNTAAPVMSAATVGGMPACSDGVWTGSPTPTFAKQFTLGGVPIAANYVFRSAELDQPVRCSVAATNSAGSATQVSNAVPVTAMEDTVSQYSLSGDASKTEGNSGATVFTYTVARSGYIAGTGSIAYVVSGTGTNPASVSDFIGGAFPTGSVSFAAGETSKTFTVAVAGDTAIESDETFLVTLGNAQSQGIILTGSVTSTIVNDDAAAPTRIGPNLTAGGTATFAPGKSGFAQERTGGYGLSASPSDAFANGTTWTIEGMIAIAAAPTGVKVAFGESHRGWIGVASNGRIVANYNGVSNTDVYFNGTTASGGGTNPVITDGVRRHVALVSNGASGVSLYLDGVLVGSSVTTAYAGSGDAPFAIGTHGPSPASYIWPGPIDEVAVFNVARYTSSFTPPAAPYVGDEVGLKALYHLDGTFDAAT